MKIYDYIIIGSGFGGSVSVMHLTEKGYSLFSSSNAANTSMTMISPNPTGTYPNISGSPNYVFSAFST